MAGLYRGLAVLSFVAALGAGGAAAQQSGADPGYATRSYTPPDFRMPEGSDCAADIARWQAVQENDYASGNVGLKVYNQIKGETARAEAACTAGHDGQAKALVAASKRRHGYPG